MSNAAMTFDLAASSLVGPAFSRPGAGERAGILSLLSIGTRFGLVVVVAMVTVLLTIALLLVSDRRMDAATAELSSYGDLLVLTAAVERRVADLQIQARRFIADRDPDGATAFHNQVIEVAGLLERIKVHDGTRTAGDLVDRLRVAVDEATTAFAQMQVAAESMGLTEDTGLRGKLRASVNAVETELRKWPWSRLPRPMCAC